MNPKSSFLGSLKSLGQDIGSVINPFAKSGVASRPAQINIPTNNNLTNSPSATPTTPTNTSVASTTNSPAKKEYLSTLTPTGGSVENINGGQSYSNPMDNPSYVASLNKGGNTGTVSNVGAGNITQPTPPEDPFASYASYLKGYQDTANTANSRLADIQNRVDETGLKARREYESTLDTPGMLKAGAEQAANKGRYRSDQNLADLAIQESAAARTANVAQTALGNAKPLQIGDNYYDPKSGKLIVSKLQSVSEKYGTGSIGEYQFAKDQGYKGTFEQYQNEDANRKAKATGAGSGSDKILSVTEAQALGVPYGTTQSQAVGLSVSGKPTVEQSKARQFAVSAENANTILDTLKDKGGFNKLPVPNLLKTEDRQKFEQASRAFVNSVLRRESGATITDDEYNNKFRELIPQLGDGQGVLDQKQAARNAAVLSVKEAGGNYSPSSTVSNGLPQQMSLNGQILTLQADGTYQ